MSNTLTKTIDDVMTEVRQLLNDVGVGGSAFRFSQALLISYLNTALREVYRLRPDAFIGNFTQGILNTYSTIVTYVPADFGLNPGTPFPVDDRLFFNPVVFYIVGRAELADDEFVDTNRAMTLLTAFGKQLTSGGG